MRKPFSRALPEASLAGLPVQVAAVCYRLRSVSVEFLLVNTSAGKWTFPKGRIDPLFSASESAAQEALEEAGAMGLIEPVHFASYLDSKRTAGQEGLAREILIAAYLLEVRRCVVPEEADRNPTWFSAEESKRRLSEKRAPKPAILLHDVIDLAVERASRRVRPRVSEESRPGLQAER